MLPFTSSVPLPRAVCVCFCALCSALTAPPRLQSAFDYDDALGEYTFPNMGYEGVNSAAPQAHSNEPKPRIILMGLRRSGKSSIQKVHIAQPHCVCANAVLCD